MLTKLEQVVVDHTDDVIIPRTRCIAEVYNISSALLAGFAQFIVSELLKEGKIMLRKDDSE